MYLVSGYTGTMPRPVALITGPTSGIGAGFAQHYADLGYDLVLVARGVDRLEQIASELRHAGRTVEVLPADLSDPADRRKVADRLAVGVRVLVNNAGAMPGKFWTTDPAQLQAQLDLNVTAVMQLTRAALPAMLASGTGTVINVASVAGLLPGPVFGSMYSASKAWVVAFTEVLARELKDTGVGVHAVCPGITATEFFRKAGTAEPQVPSFMWLEVDDVVSRGVADVARGKVISIPGMQYKALVSVGRILPPRLMRAFTDRVGTPRRA